MMPSCLVGVGIGGGLLRPGVDGQRPGQESGGEGQGKGTFQVFHDDFSFVKVIVGLEPLYHMMREKGGKVTKKSESRGVSGRGKGMSLLLT